LSVRLDHIIECIQADVVSTSNLLPLGHMRKKYYL
jgi:hypothetical protein